MFVGFFTDKVKFEHEKQKSDEFEAKSMGLGLFA